ncbi:MAG: GNAT family N-acetyltransferase [Asgard group archaeon]|nr:GNAT family N-acetyltransferase [Asgard group archaeon]
MIKIEQINEFDKLKSILKDFLRENQLPKEKTIEQLKVYEEHFNREDSIYFLATINEESKGFISCDIWDKIIKTNRLFAKKCKEYDDIIFELLSFTYNQLKSLNKKYFQIFIVNSLKISQRLENDNFKVNPRVRMVYDLKENQMPENTLNSAYQVDHFTLDKLDEELQIVIDAFKGTLDGEIFVQFADLTSIKELFYRSKMDGENCRADSPIIKKDDKIVGVNIISNISDKASYVWIIAILPEHRGNGLGKYLMLKSHENCKKAGVEQMVLDVTLANETAHSLYQKIGYKETMRYLNVLKKYENE